MYSKVIFALLEEPIIIASPTDPITVAQIALWIAHSPAPFSSLSRMVALAMIAWWIAFASIA